jgi:hypothetical protein
LSQKKYFQYTQEKKYWMKNVFLSQYLFVAISQYRKQKCLVCVTALNMTPRKVPERKGVELMRFPRICTPTRHSNFTFVRSFSSLKQILLEASVIICHPK